MLEWVRNTPAFRMHLTVFCVIIRNVWWDISNSYMARGIDLVVVLKYTFFQLTSNVEKISVRLTRFRRSYINRPAIVLTNHTSLTPAVSFDLFIDNYFTSFRLFVCLPALELTTFEQRALLCLKWPRFFFCSCFFLMVVYLRNLFFLNICLARMLLTPRWVSRQKDDKMWNSYP